VLTAGAKLHLRGEVLVQGGTDPQRRHPPRTWPPANARLKLLQWVIPPLTGVVLVVNARMGEQQRPPRSPAGCLPASDQDELPDQGRRYQNGFGAPQVGLAQCRGSLSSLNQSLGSGPFGS
jgi:hypothetical protein